ncbi:MAG: ATP-binding protein, partial [Candidatus Methylomirabilia bacterium]
EIAVRALQEPDGGLAISVADTGIGIAKEDIPRALTPFVQGEASLTRKHEGAGLGLSLVRSFARLHGGSLSIDSEVGVGTVVTIRFPASRVVARAGLAGAGPGH